MRHPNNAYLRKFILLGKEFVLLCKMIGKQQKMSSRRSANKMYHISCSFSWYTKNSELENGVESENWTTEE